MATNAIDFSSIGGKPVSTGGIDFSSIGGKPVTGTSAAAQVPDAPDDSTWGKVKAFFSDLHTKSQQLNQDAFHMNPQQFAAAHPEFTQAPSDAEQAYGDVKAGNYAKAIHRTVTGLGAGLAPLLIPAVAGAPLATAGALALATGGKYVGKKIGEAAGLTPEQSDVAGDVGMFAGGAVGGAGGAKLSDLVPSTERAAASLQDVRATAGDVPIDTTKPGNTALELYTQSQRGAVLPKVVRDFVNRATKPDADPITYGEAKDFQSNISRLSANERMNLNPNTARLVGQLNQDLKGSLEAAADTEGKGQQFSDAMKEYHNAMTLRGWTDDAKAAALKDAINALKIGGAGFVLKKLLQ